MSCRSPRGARPARRLLARLRVAAVALGVAAAGLAEVRAQDDRRDVVTLRTGAPLRGRVFARWQPDVVAVRVGKDLQQVPIADIVAMDTVRDRVREFFALLDRLPDNLRHRWYMAQWAAARELPDLARLVAWDVVLRDPGHADAHVLLGHRLVDGQWSWPCDGEWMSFAAIGAVRADWQHPWQIEGEHFRVRCNADLRRAVDAVWDLERFHLAWFDRFGEALHLYEIVGEKIEVQIWRDPERFPGTSTFPGRRADKHPIFRHSIRGEPAVSCTYFATASEPRPVRLFEVATSHLLYRTVADNPAIPSFYRAAAWGEIGLARYLQNSVTGPAGAAALGSWRIDPAGARLVLAPPARNLNHVTQYDLKKLFQSVTDESEREWAAAELAVAYLLEAGQADGLRAGFFGYLEEVVRYILGSSSRALDRHLGRPIENLDAPWRAWIRQQIEAPTPGGTPPVRRP